MEIKELQKRKNELQSAISRQVARLIEEFKKETGASPSRLSIDMVFFHDMGHDPEYIVGETSVNIEI